MRRYALPLSLTLALSLCALPSFAAQMPAGPSLLQQVPDRAVAVVTIAKSGLAMARHLVDEDAAMRSELGDYLARALGVDLTRVDGAVAWSTELSPKASFAAFLSVPGAGALHGRVVGSRGAVPLVAIDKWVAAVVPGGVLIGDRTEVEAGIDVAQHRAPGLSTHSALGTLFGAASSDFAAGLAAAAGDPSSVKTAEQFGVRTVTLELTSANQVVLEAAGDPQKLEGARRLISTVMTAGIAQLKQAKDRAAQGADVLAGVSAIVGYYQAARFWKEFQPRLVGDKLVSRYQLPDPKSTNLLVPMVGVMAAVAIPAFTKYLRRAKTVEATSNVRAMASGAIVYYEAHRKAGRFPPSTSWTPGAACCGQSGDKCAPASGAFSAAGWKALGFSVDEPHYYQYRFTSQGRGKHAHFVAEARGDLDCDGQTSSFQVVGTVSAQGDVTLAPLKSTDELE